NNGGICIVGGCSCAINWSGATCTTPTCSPACNPTGGSCSAPNTCSCSGEWTGPTCSIPPKSTGTGASVSIYYGNSYKSVPPCTLPDHWSQRTLFDGQALTFSGSFLEYTF